MHSKVDIQTIGRSLLVIFRVRCGSRDPARRSVRHMCAVKVGEEGVSGCDLARGRMDEQPPLFTYAESTISGVAPQGGLVDGKGSEVKRR